MKYLRSPLRWFGGKGKLVSKLLKYVPPHVYYLEAYGGGASLLFAKKPSEFEVYNDIDGDLVNLFRVLRDEQKFEKFYRKVCLTPYSREEYNYCRTTYENCEDEIERAYRFFVLVRQSFSGSKDSWSYSVRECCKKMVDAVSRWLSIIDLLPAIHERIMRVQIENLPALECIEKYGSAWNYDESFIYLDPPYLPETRREGGYKYEMTREDHEELIKYLIKNQNRNKFMLSGYDNELYRELENEGWQKISWEVACHAVGKTRYTSLLGEGATFKNNQRRVECIWINYEITKQEKLFFWG